jgi:hypothetical protein
VIRGFCEDLSAQRKRQANQTTRRESQGGVEGEAEEASARRRVLGGESSTRAKGKEGMAVRSAQ